MRRLLFRPRAIADIDGIWDYTADRWGVAQADRYILVLRATCEAIAGDTLPGRDASAARPAYRKRPPSVPGADMASPLAARLAILR